MIIADTHIFIDFLRKRAASEEFAAALGEGEVFLHPFVEGELYLSGIPGEVKDLLSYLPRAALVDHKLVLHFIDLYGNKISGVGYVDIHLLLSAAQMNARLMTRDQALLKLFQLKS